MDSITLLLEKANKSSIGSLGFNEFWDLDDTSQIEMFEKSLEPLLSSLYSDKSIILGKSFNRHHFSKGFLAEEFHELEDLKRCVKHKIVQNFLTNYVLVEPIAEGWSVKVVAREYVRTFIHPYPSRAVA